ncbi:MAG: type 2 isopentenyl-diphosphate Delta-isomerase [Candidatus Hadarchaeales archaeon]
MGSKTERRKSDHVRICLEEEIESILKNPGFDDIELVHSALPEINLEDVDLSVNFLGANLRAPIMILPMTGGHARGKKLNLVMAKAAQELGLAFGVGSQRAAIENKKLAATFRVRDVAPDVFLVGNIGLPQLLKGYGIEEVKECAEMIDADAMSIHLNPLQEAVQPEGEPIFKGGIEKISEICRGVDFPIIVKETGAGINGEIARKLEGAGAAAMDGGGAGGTSWAGVEALRSSDAAGISFWDWGIPTAVCTMEVASAVEVPVIASGGVRCGIDAVKALALGADLVGVALPVLREATRGEKHLMAFLKDFIQEMKIGMFLTGCRKVEELRRVPIAIFGKTREWLLSRGLDLVSLARCRK